jgi:hypothetical protein
MPTRSPDLRLMQADEGCVQWHPDGTGVNAHLADQDRLRHHLHPRRHPPWSIPGFVHTWFRVSSCAGWLLPTPTAVTTWRSPAGHMAWRHCNGRNQPCDLQVAVVLLRARQHDGLARHPW